MKTFADFIAKIQSDILSPLVYLLISVAVIIFLWGVVGYIKSGDSEEERKKAKDFILYGIIGLFVMISVWGLVNILSGTFPMNKNVPAPPQYNSQ
jgi:uncharacterized membrane protein